MNSEPFQIAIDGPTASGKGTVARLLAQQFGLISLDTGAVYRAITIYFMDNKIDHTKLAQVKTAVEKLDLDVKCDESGNTVVILGGQDITERLHDIPVSVFVPEIAKISIIRTKVRDIQKTIAGGKTFVCEGRDITSVVFPQARFKFYLDAKLKERAKRRYLQEIAKGEKVTLAQVQSGIDSRDRADMTREISPLVRVPDAIRINATKKSAKQVVAKMERIIKKKLGKQEKQKKNDFKKPVGAVVVRRLAKIILYVPYKMVFWTKITNKKELKQHRGKGVILAVQHRSNLDVLSLISCMPTLPINLVGKESLFKIRLLNWFLRCMNAVPLRAGNDLAMIRHNLGVLKRNEVLAIFPEGTRSFNPEDALAVRNGTAVIALKSGAPIVPIVTNRAPRMFRLCKFKIGKTIYPKDYADKNELSAKIKESMSQLLEGFEVAQKQKKWQREPIFNARAITFVDGKLLAIKRVRDGHQFYGIPGGHVDEGETARETIVREVKEETNIDVTVTRELYRLKSPFNGENKSKMLGMYLCQYRSGTVSKTNADEYTAGIENKLSRHDGKPKGTYDPCLLPLADLKTVELRPVEVQKQLLKDLKKYGTRLTIPTKFLK